MNMLPFCVSPASLPPLGLSPSRPGHPPLALVRPRRSQRAEAGHFITECVANSMAQLWADAGGGRVCEGLVAPPATYRNAPSSAN